MLKLASVRDYPEVFNARKLHAVLTDAELEVCAEVTGFYGQRDWLLRRVLLKDLSVAYLTARHKRYFPPNALEVREAQGGFEVFALMVSREAPVLQARCVTDGEIGVGFVASDLGTTRAAVRVRRIVRTYPFLTDAHLTPAEEDLLREQSESDLDVTATLLVTAKRLCADLVPEVHDPDAFVVRRVDGNDRVHVDRERLVLPAPLDEVLIQTWHWDDYLVAAGLLFDSRATAEGLEPARMLEWG
jgi:hypothetical protein